MPKKLLKKYSPDPQKIKEMKGLGVIGRWLHTPDLWHFHRASVSKAFLIGLFWMSIPLPSQMLASAISAILLRANLPLSVVLVWISNPLTIPPIFYFNYLVGTWVLGEDAKANLGFEMSWGWILNTLGELWLPLYLGSVIVGIVLGILGYIGIRIFWRFNVIHKWRNRHHKTQKN